MNKAMPIVVTGATGLIGSAITKYLQDAGYDVLTAGRRNENDLKCDFTKPETIKNMPLNGVAAMVHCAGVIDEYFINRPREAYYHAIRGTAHLAQRLSECGVKKLVSMSTIHVYGPLHGIITEETSVDPRSEYAVSHYAAEQMLKRAALDGEVSTTILRPCAVYSIPQKPDSFYRWPLIPYSFPIAAINDKVIRLKTSGIQRRNFIYAFDLARMVEDILFETGSVEWRIINPVGADTMSIYDFANMCAEEYEILLGKSCDIVFDNNATTELDGGFEFRTKYTFSNGVYDIRNYINEFMNWILVQNQNGRVIKI